MNPIQLVRYLKLLRTKPLRYRALFREIHRLKPKRIVEIGVFDGRHGAQMIQTAAMDRPAAEIEYLGFDLFEDLTAELLEYEKSKRPPTCDDVRRVLEATGARVRLFQGNTRETLPAHAAGIGEVDFVFVDGGHSVETIRSDWENVQPLVGPRTVVLFDDYYLNEERFVEGAGCQTILDALDPAVWRVEVLEPMDRFRKDWGVLQVKFARVSRR